MCTIAESKNNILLNFSLLFHLKNIFSFFLFLSLASLFSSFFLLKIFFFSPSSTLCFANLLWVHLYRRSSSSSPSHTTDPSRPILHCRSSSSSSSHATDLSHPVLHLIANPSSIADLSFIVDPSSTGTAFIELKSVADFVVAVWLDFMVVVGGCSWLAMVVDRFVVFLL